MASLDVLDYLTGLDDELAKPGPDGRARMPPPLRKQALRDARRVIDMMAFKFAIVDERPLPEDLDHLRAIEAVKPAPRAADVLLRRAPHYARVRRRRLATTWSVLAVLVLLFGGLAYLATSEKADTLATIVTAPATDVTYAENRTFDVRADMTRLYVTADVFVARGSQGSVEIRLVDPDGEVALVDLWTPQSNNYLRESVPPKTGTWTLVVVFHNAHGSVRAEVNGVYPAR